MIYRQGRNYENLNKMIYRGTGKFDTPRLVPEACNADSFIGFNYAKSCKDPQHKGVHFFIDDYQFTRLWTNPDAYLDMLRAFKCVFTPDFSTYTDFPKAVQIWNHYRKHWLGAYWQSNGITVIPTISWSDESSFDWCFDGEPVGGAVAVSSVGTQILFYGSIPAECSGDKIVPILTFQDSLKHRVSKKFTQDEGNSQEDML